MTRLDETLSVARRWAGRREPWLVLLFLFALCYFGSYYRHSFNFRDETGTVPLIAKRLLDGERPIRDVALGYNVLWYYPYVALFKVFGVNFVLARAYCFALSTLAALLGFLTVDRVSRRPWLAFLVGSMLVVVPGMTFKNYMPFLVVTNIALLTMFMLGSRRQEQSAAEASVKTAPFRWGWLALGGVGLGLTYLIRIDLGMFFSALWLGAVAFVGLGPKQSASQRIAAFLGGPALLAALIVAVHLPVYWDAQRRGFDEQFIRQYTAWPNAIVDAVNQRFFKGTNAVPHVPQAAAVQAKDAGGVDKKKANREVLKRKGLLEFLGSGDIKAQLLAILLYAPLLTLIPLSAWALVQMAGSWRRGDSTAFRNAATALLLVGGAFTAFPQYFFFRPDSPHLSEFSPGFWVGSIGALVLLCSSSERRRWPALGIIIACILTAHAAAFLFRMVPDRWTGTIAARFGRTRLLEAANGVNVYLNKREWNGFHDLLEVINTHSKPGEYLVAYPYHPGINLAADRPTYERDVYVDNAIRPPKWDDQAIARFEKYKPAVIVISEWDINGTEESRFSHWAAKTKTWVQTNYIYQGTYLEFEVYSRPESAQPRADSAD